MNKGLYLPEKALLRCPNDGADMICTEEYNNVAVFKCKCGLIVELRIRWEPK